MNWIGVGTSDIGCHRKNNEDRFVVNNMGGLYLVADGMGGLPGGEIAAELVASELPNFVRHSFEKAQSLSDPHFHVMVQEDIQAVNDLITREGLRRDMEGMGSTVVMLLIKNDKAMVVHVGDSRCYRFRSRHMELLTRDHASAAYPNCLTKVMGMEEPVQGDIVPLDVTAEDEFLLCSDGLNHMLTDDIIETTFLNTDPPDRIQVLIETAKAAGGDDNITVIRIAAEPT